MDLTLCLVISSSTKDASILTPTTKQNILGQRLPLAVDGKTIIRIYYHHTGEQAKDTQLHMKIVGMWSRIKKTLEQGYARMEQCSEITVGIVDISIYVKLILLQRILLVRTVVRMGWNLRIIAKHGAHMLKFACHPIGGGGNMNKYIGYITYGNIRAIQKFNTVRESVSMVPYGAINLGEDIWKSLYGAIIESVGYSPKIVDNSVQISNVHNQENVNQT